MAASTRLYVTYTLLAVLACALSACQAPGPTASPTPVAPPLTPSAASTASLAPIAPPSATSTPRPSASNTASPARVTLTPGASENALAAQARADLAARLGLAENEIALVAVEQSELPQADLGCPPPGATPGPAVPAVVIGTVLRFEAAGQTYEYHAHGRRLVFCGP